LNGATLELVEVNADDRDLEEVRQQIKEAEGELKRLRALPTSSADIETRVKNYVRGPLRLAARPSTLAGDQP
jgi:hypothetical protein